MRLELILKGEKGITCRPADLIEPELDKIREEIKEYIEQDEDVLTYALFPQPAINSLQIQTGTKIQRGCV